MALLHLHHFTGSHDIPHALCAQQGGEEEGGVGGREKDVRGEGGERLRVRVCFFFELPYNNCQVRKAFLNAIGCREAAKKQETMQDMRRASVAYLRRKSSAGLLPPNKELSFANGGLLNKKNKKSKKEREFDMMPSDCVS